MLVGETLAGKSIAWKSLQKALSTLARNKVKPETYYKVEVSHLNPKSIDINELFGYNDSSGE